MKRALPPLLALVSNDDGYLAPGLAALAGVAAGFGAVMVVAPDRNRSGASNSLTLNRPLRLHQAPSGFWVVDGTPTDCVHLALTTATLAPEAGLVLSGINSGENLGDDCLYSGTVAAAMEGHLMGRPAIAVSLAGHEPTHFSTAARVVERLLTTLLPLPLPPDLLLNVNVPDIAYEDLRGVKVTRLGVRHPSSAAVAAQDPRGRPIYWVGAAGAPQDAAMDTDFAAVRSAYVSVTPLQVDLTRHQALDTVRAWMQPINLQTP